jgi:hypothetical protein
MIKLPWISLRSGIEPHIIYVIFKISSLSGMEISTFKTKLITMKFNELLRAEIVINNQTTEYVRTLNIQ